MRHGFKIHKRNKDTEMYTSFLDATSTNAMAIYGSCTSLGLVMVMSLHAASSSPSHQWHQPCSNTAPTIQKLWSKRDTASSWLPLNIHRLNKRSPDQDSIPLSNNTKRYLSHLKHQILELLAKVKSTMPKFVRDGRVRPDFISSIQTLSVLPGMPVLDENKILSLGKIDRLRASLPEMYEALSILSIFFNEIVDSEKLAYQGAFTKEQSMWNDVQLINAKLYPPMCGLYILMTRFNVQIPQDIHVSLSMRAEVTVHAVTDRATRFQRDYIVLDSTKSTLLALKRIFQLLLS